MSTLDGLSTTQLAPGLGALLHNYRTESGETAKSVSRRCSLGVVQIAQLELGRAELDIDLLADAVAAYAVPRCLFPPRHCEVRVDLVAGTVSVHPAETEVVETAADRILLAYFEMIFTEGSMAPSTAIPFTDLDLDVLRVVLSGRRREVSEHLHRIAGPFDEPLVLPPAVTRRTARSALLVFAAAATSLAGVAAVHQSTSSSVRPAVAPIEVQIAEAAVITR